MIRFGDVVVHPTSNKGCQFDIYIIKCQTSTKISGNVNELVQYVRNYYRNVNIADLNRKW